MIFALSTGIGLVVWRGLLCGITRRNRVFSYLDIAETLSRAFIRKMRPVVWIGLTKVI